MRGNSHFSGWGAISRNCAVGVLLLGAGACGPPEVVPVTPPGVEYVPPIPEGDVAEALGEQLTQGAVQPSDLTPNPPTDPGRVVTTKSGLKYETLRAGTGVEAKPGQRMRVHYVGTLTNGTEFDSSRRRDTPFEFKLGQKQVIAGWDEGITGMRVGELRKLTVPAILAYGAEGRGDKIPPNSTLIFEIELLDAS